jgi:uncharacterized protein (DUF1499 family)
MAKTRTRVASRLGIVGAAAFVLGPLLAHFGIVPAIAGFALFGFGGLLGVVTLALGIVGAARHGVGAARGGLALGVALTGAFAWIALPGRAFPPINDITTDTANPPRFVTARSVAPNQGRDMTYPAAAFAAQQRAGYPDVRPLELSVSRDEAFKRVQIAAQEMPGWEIVRVDAAAYALEGVATSRVFRFQDDFVVEVHPQDGGSVVHMRSKSRDGRGDVGANAARIKAFFEKVRSF